MFDLSFAELGIIAVIAMLFIGPKELPVIIKSIAKLMRGLRSVMNEIRAAFDDMAKESGVKDVVGEIKEEARMIQGDDGKWYEAYDAPDHTTPDILKDGKDE